MTDHAVGSHHDRLFWGELRGGLGVGADPAVLAARHSTGGLRPLWRCRVAGSYALSLRAAADAGIAIRVAFVPGLDLGGVLSFRIDSLSATSAGNFCLAGRIATHSLGRKDWSLGSHGPVGRGSRRFAGTADLGLLACGVAHPGGC